MNKIIKVQESSITKNDGKVKVMFHIDDCGEQKTLFFLFDEGYEKFVTVDRGDALLVMLFKYAMEKQADLRFCLPISERLYYQIKTYLIDAMHQENNNYRNINIEADLIDKVYKKEHKGKVIAAGMSRGVDSLCTYISHNQLKRCADYKINLFTFFNMGACHYDDGRKKVIDGKSVYKENMNETLKLAEEENIPVLVVDSNFVELFPMPHEIVDALRNCGTVLLFQKLIDVYYYSSTYNLNLFHLDPETPAAYYDIYTLQNISTDSTLFYSSNSSYTRFRKIQTISNSQLAQKYLTVCTAKFHNCGKCAKCVYTLLSLDCLNALDDFKNVFNIEDYKRSSTMQKGYALASRKEAYYEEIVPELKKRKKIPFLSYIYCGIFTAVKPIEQRMRKMSPRKRRKLIKFAEKYHIRVPF